MNCLHAYAVRRSDANRRESKTIQLRQALCHTPRPKIPTTRDVKKYVTSTRSTIAPDPPRRELSRGRGSQAAWHRSVNTQVVLEGHAGASVVHLPVTRGILPQNRLFRAVVMVTN